MTKSIKLINHSYLESECGKERSHEVTKTWKQTRENWGLADVTSLYWKICVHQMQDITFHLKIAFLTRMVCLMPSCVVLFLQALLPSPAVACQPRYTWLFLQCTRAQHPCICTPKTRTLPYKFIFMWLCCTPPLWCEIIRNTYKLLNSLASSASSFYDKNM